MRILILITFIINSAFAQIDPGTGVEGNCTEGSFLLPATDPLTNTYDCQDVAIGNLSIVNDPTLPLTIRATGTVTITGTVSFNGSNAVEDNGGAGGPAGGGNGGTNQFGVATSGEPAFPNQGGNNPTDPSCSNPGSAEGSGGGGGSLISFGDPGFKGTLSSGIGPVITDPGTPGQDLITFNVNNFVFAGSGGGPGGAGCENSSTTGQTPGGGGGGGGAIKIISAGDITITGSINVSGGNGGTTTTISGGGGGGSGGIIALQSLSKINLNSTLLALGGQGGTNSTPGESGNGGNGAPGYIYLEDKVDGIRTYTGSFTPPPSPSKQSLNSDISCGTIAESEESHSNALMLMALGFLLALGTKILFQFPMKLSRKFVHRN